MILRWAALPDGTRGLYTDHPPTIVISTALNRVDRNATLMHELIHHERGICGESRVDERGVDDEVARRLVPSNELAAMYEIAVANDLPVEPHMVADKFDVPSRVAERAMSLFLETLSVPETG